MTVIDIAQARLKRDIARAAELVVKHDTGKIQSFVLCRDDGVIVGKGWAFECARQIAREDGVNVKFEEAT